MTARGRMISNDVFERFLELELAAYAGDRAVSAVTSLTTPSPLCSRSATPVGFGAAYAWTWELNMSPTDAFALRGRGVPEWLVKNLRGLGFSRPLRSSLGQEQLSLDPSGSLASVLLGRPTPIQMQCFPAIMGGSHVRSPSCSAQGLADERK